MYIRLLRQVILITASLLLAGGSFLYAAETVTSVQSPEWATIRTACNRITLNNGGNLGHQGAGEYNFDFFNDCDTTENHGGMDDNAAIYLYDASPFLLRAKGNKPGDTVLNSYIFDADWQNRDGFLPTSPLVVDSSNPDFQYVFTGRFITPDSAMGIECEYWMPLHPDTCGILIQKMKVVNRTGVAISYLMVGELMDWNIPSDSGTENGSDFDAARQMMWCFGAEYGPDGIANNDCIPANQRAGGLAYLNGYHLPANYSGNRFATIHGMFTGMNADWIMPTGNFVPQQLFKKLISLYSYQVWVSTQPAMEDSLYQNLFLVAYFGHENLHANDTLVWINVLAAESDGGAMGLKARVDKAKQWWKNRFNIAPKVIDPGDKCTQKDRPISFIVTSFDLDDDAITLTATGLPGTSTFTDNGNSTGTFNWTPPDYGHFSFTVIADDGKATDSATVYVAVAAACCVKGGDANHDGKNDIRDITYLITFLYKGGPKPPCIAEGNANSSAGCTGINIQDVTYLIGYLYKGGPAPRCGPECCD